MSTPHPGRPDPGQDVELAALSLPELRAYRQRLRDEEDRVSYWRRLVHARIDLLEAGRSTDGTLSHEALVRALGDTGTGASRDALLRVRAEEPLPDVPALADVWATPQEPHQTAQALEGLRRAERQLTCYRAALFARLDAAGAELVRRYRDDPLQALTVLA